MGKKGIALAKSPTFFNSIEQFINDYAVVLALFVLAIGVRVYQFGLVPGGFNQDEAMSAYDAYLLARYGMDRIGMRLPIHFNAWGFGNQSAFMLYAMVPFYWLFGLSVVTARMPVLLFSLIGLYTMYLFTEDAFGKRWMSVAVLAVGAINPWHIMQSRWALDCNMFPHVMMIGCWLLYRGLEGVETHANSSYWPPKPDESPVKKRINYNSWLAASMVFFAICLYSYGIALYTVPVFLLAMTIYLLVVDRRLFFIPLLISLGVFLVVAWPILAMVFINYFERPTFSALGFTIPFFYTNRMDELLFFGSYPREQLMHNTRSLTRILLQQDDAPWNTVPGYGTLFIWSIPFTSLGLFSAFGFKKSMGKVILLFWLAMAIFAGLVVRGANVNRVNIIFYPLIILMGIGMYEAVMLAKMFRTKLAVAALLIVISAASFTFFARTYFGDHADRLERNFFGGFFHSITYAQEQGYDRLYVTAQTAGRYQWQLTEVLLLFGARVDPTLFFDTYNFRDIYRIRSFDSIPYRYDTQDIRVLYIFSAYEQQHFPYELFDITWKDGYGVARFR